MAFRLSLAILILWLSAIPGFPAESVKTVSLSGHIAELEQLSTAVESSRKNPQAIEEIIKHLPSRWIVQAEGRSYQIPGGWLWVSLKELKAQQSDAAFQKILTRIAELKANAQALQQSPQDPSSSKKALASILARREFKGVHGPTSMDALRQKLLELLGKFLELLFGSSTFPAVSKVIIWILVAGASVILIISIIKIVRRSVKLEAIQIESSSSWVSAKSWVDWLEEARAAAEKSSWRDAVHLTYWASISFLESRGVWHPDKARTPREYLRLLASSSEYHISLSALTHQFETIWYGGAAAGPDSFSEALSHLGGLGCPCN
jgi:hypothetical protein